VAGKFDVAADFDPSTTGTATLSPTNPTDEFLAKYDSNGNFLWARRIGGTGDNEIVGNVAVGSDGSVYFAGIFAGTGGITGVESTSSATRVEHPVPGGSNLVSSNPTKVKRLWYWDGLVARFDANGALTWVKHFGGAGAFTRINDVAVSGSGAVYVTGYFSNTVDFDPGPGVANRTSAGGTFDMFAMRLNAADGTFVWASAAGATGFDLGQSVAVAPDGGAYITGQFEATVSLGGTTLVSRGASDAFVARLAPDGTFAWARSMGGPAYDSGQGVAALRDGTVDTVYVTGTFDAPSAQFADPINYPGDAGAQVLTYSGGTAGALGAGDNAFVSKFVDTGAAGNFVWTDQLAPPPGATTGSAHSGDLTVDTFGGVYTTGSFTGTVDFDPGAATAPLTATTTDTYVSKLNADGSYAWAKRMGAPPGSTKPSDNKTVGISGVDLAWDATSGAVFVTGRYSGVFDTGTGTLTGGGTYVVKIDQLSPLLAAGGPVAGAKAFRLTDAQLQPIVAAAIDRWAAAGLDAARLDVLRHATVTVADLGGAYLGLADPASHAVRIDDDAAVRGWFVDPTPHDDAEFVTPGDKRVSGRMDLLSVVAHELGHLVALDDDHNAGHAADVMGGSLATGTRRTPTVVDVSPVATVGASGPVQHVAPVATSAALRRGLHRR
jgi:hypothetical protein